MHTTLYVPFDRWIVAEPSHDRRHQRRYAINLPVSYKAVKERLISQTGTGSTIDMSSKGIAIHTSTLFKPKTRLVLSIDWPILLNGSCPLNLVVSGRVIRSDGESTVVAVISHDFCTKG